MEPLANYAYESVDLSDPDSLLAHAKRLEGHTFREILDLGICPDGVTREYGSKRYKGGMGTLIEERYFGYKANSDSRPDFPEAGVELKSTCYDLRKDGTPAAGERLVLTMIPFDAPIEDEFIGSHAWSKAHNILLIYYGRDRSIDGYDQRIEHVALFSPPPADLAIMEEDYRTIRDLVQSGHAEDLSEGLTRYLGACTKGATAEKSYSPQFYAPYTLAKRRAFCFKQPYMNYVLNHYLIGDEGDSECIIKDPSVLRHHTFEEYVLSLVEPYIGKTDREICQELGLPYTGNKAQWTSLSYHMLGLTGDTAEEFSKANINVRTVRIEATGGVRESMSLDTFSFKELAQQNSWEDSELFSYFEETRFFFLAFQKGQVGAVFRGGRFWSMPAPDIDGPLRECWEKTRDKVRNGITFVEKTDSAGKVTVKNDLPKKIDNSVAHVRPHASRCAYRLADGLEMGDVLRDGDELPDGQWMTKQSFWLNSDYIYDIVKNLER